MRTMPSLRRTACDEAIVVEHAGIERAMAAVASAASIRRRKSVAGIRYAIAVD